MASLRYPSRGRPRQPQGKATPPHGHQRFWRIRWYDDQGRRRSVEAQTEAEVRRKYDDARLHPGLMGSTHVPDHQQWKKALGWLQWWYDHPRETWKGSTRRRHQQYLGAYVIGTPKRPHVADTSPLRGVDLREVTRDHIAAILAQAVDRRDNPLTGMGKRHLRATLSVAFADAMDRRLLDHNPCHGVKVPLTATPVDKVIPPEHISQFVALCLTTDEGGHRIFPLGDALAFLALTGLRAGELRAAHLSAWLKHWGTLAKDVLMENREAMHILTVEATLAACANEYVPQRRVVDGRSFDEVKVTPCIVRGPTKSGHPRNVPLTHQAMEILLDRLMVAEKAFGLDGLAETPIFPAPQGGYLIARALNDELARVRELEPKIAAANRWTTVGIVPEKVHTLRATAATALCHVAPIPVVAEILGHRDGGKLLFERYAKPTPRGAAEAIAKFNEVIHSTDADVLRTPFQRYPTKVPQRSVPRTPEPNENPPRPRRARTP